MRIRVRHLLIETALIAALLVIGQMRRRAVEYGARSSAAGSSEQVWTSSEKTSKAGSSQVTEEARREPDPQEDLIVGASGGVCDVDRAFDSGRIAVEMKRLPADPGPILSRRPGR
jgi:hypothetical protein